MPQVVYDGPQPERSLVGADGARIVAKKGQKVEVDAETAKSLCEQEYWHRHGKKESE